MINKLQKLISELEAEKEKAKECYLESQRENDNIIMTHESGVAFAFSLCIEKLNKILKEETAKDLPCPLCKGTGKEIQSIDVSKYYEE